MEPAARGAAKPVPENRQSGGEKKGLYAMRTIPLGKSGLQVPAIAVGCLRINGAE